MLPPAKARSFLQMAGERMGSCSPTRIGERLPITAGVAQLTYS
jgi:hypothetical protein